MYDLVGSIGWLRDTKLRGHAIGDLLDGIVVYDVKPESFAGGSAASNAFMFAEEGRLALRRIHSAIKLGGDRIDVRELVLVDPTRGGRRRRTSQAARQAIEAATLATALAAMAESLQALDAPGRRAALRELRAGGADTRRAIGALLAGSRDPNVDASVVGSWRMLLSPRMTTLLMSEDATHPRMGTRYVTEVLAHEFEHTVTPADPSGPVGRNLGWLEEGSADVLARWPGVAKRHADAMGIAAPPAAQPLQGKYLYDQLTAGVRRLLVLADVDVTDAAAIERARELLQSGSLGSTPRRLAEAIGAARSLEPARVAELERRIRRLDGSAAAIDRLERWLGTAPSPRPAES
jgi:hypothetical protein